MATVPSSGPPAGRWWPSTLDGGVGRRKIEQPRRAGCSRSLAEAFSCSPADGSSYNEVANKGNAVVRRGIGEEFVHQVRGRDTVVRAHLLQHAPADQPAHGVRHQPDLLGGRLL